LTDLVQTGEALGYSVGLFGLAFGLGLLLVAAAVLVVVWNNACRFATPRVVRSSIAVAAAGAIFLVWYGMDYISYRQAESAGLSITPAAAAHLELRATDASGSVPGRSLLSESVLIRQHTLFIKTDPKVLAGVWPGASCDTSSNGVQGPPVTLYLDGGAAAVGFAAKDWNVVDIGAGPAAGQTGFFYSGPDFYDVYRRISALR
jgi:hypothetical protein